MVKTQIRHHRTRCPQNVVSDQSLLFALSKRIFGGKKVKINTCKSDTPWVTNGLIKIARPEETAKGMGYIS